MTERAHPRGRMYVSGTTLLLGVVGAGAAATVTTLSVLSFGGTQTGHVIAALGQPALELAAALITAWSALGLKSVFLRRVWLVIAGGILGAVIGDAMWSYAEITQGAPSAYPGLSEIAYAIEYAAFAGAMTAVIASYRHRVRLLLPALESLAVTTVLCVLGWFGIAAPTLAKSGVALDASTATDLAFIAADLVLIGMAGMLHATLLRSGDRRMLWPWVAFALGVVAIAVGDLAWFAQQAYGTYRPGSLGDFAWMAGHGLIAVGAMLQLDEERARTR